ncbi:MAG: zinc ribbon domain-containing protein [Acidobacteria bacterium]|nr:zinc ribbon domain-containing protein [Acidobacteriota bacterium]
MPIHEYECLKCGTRFEELQRFSEAPLKRHNGCGGRVKRLLSAPAFQFKGTGWYVTDYARKNNGGDGKAKEAKEAKEAKADHKADSKGKSESKAESKADSKTETASTKKDDAKPAAKTTKS